MKKITLAEFEKAYPDKHFEGYAVYTKENVKLEQYTVDYRKKTVEFTGHRIIEIEQDNRFLFHKLADKEKDKFEVTWNIDYKLIEKDGKYIYVSEETGKIPDQNEILDLIIKQINEEYRGTQITKFLDYQCSKYKDNPNFSQKDFVKYLAAKFQDENNFRYYENNEPLLKKEKQQICLHWIKDLNQSNGKSFECRLEPPQIDELYKSLINFFIDPKIPIDEFRKVFSNVPINTIKNKIKWKQSLPLFICLIYGFGKPKKYDGFSYTFDGIIKTVGNMHKVAISCFDFNISTNNKALSSKVSVVYNQKSVQNLAKLIPITENLKKKQ